MYKITEPMVTGFLKGKRRGYKREHYIPAIAVEIYIQKFGKESDSPFGWADEVGIREAANEILEHLEPIFFYFPEPSGIESKLNDSFDASAFFIAPKIILEVIA